MSIAEQRIHVIGEEDFVLLCGLLGIDGTIIENAEDFQNMFEILVKDSSIGMIFIFMDLPRDILDYLLEFKVSNRSPFVYILPNIFLSDIENRDIFFNRIFESIEEIIT
ncbi:MAG: V-type ATP synthase subunit F [Candidatus Thorarchaeota archaeon]